ncbi:uncharacterized protein LOC130451435 [Diorhabda sublineata]|uniref:uncharacterized protein LOC130451435 n=1 Tax=Diorhabda sublineata TaxID=1163346 RepID=UPI0024E17640|nr:uncharacterized protein LOC130451435 [Diorhabda sublineata]
MEISLNNLFLYTNSAIVPKENGTVEDDDLIVQLVSPIGKIHGHIMKSQNGYDFYAFQYVPYAQPPIGEQRFKMGSDAGWSDDSGVLHEVSGTGHGLDLVYFWDTPSSSALVTSETNRKVLLKLWTNFINDQNPTPQQNADFQNDIWPTTQPSTLLYLDINDAFSFGTTPRQYEEVKNILDKYLPFNVY